MRRHLKVAATVSRPCFEALHSQTAINAPDEVGEVAREPAHEEGQSQAYLRARLLSAASRQKQPSSARRTLDALVAVVDEDLRALRAQPGNDRGDAESARQSLPVHASEHSLEAPFARTEGSRPGGRGESGARAGAACGEDTGCARQARRQAQALTAACDRKLHDTKGRERERTRLLSKTRRCQQLRAKRWNGRRRTTRGTD